MSVRSPSSKLFSTFASYHTRTHRSLLYQCVIEGKLLLGSAGTTLGSLWRQTLLIYHIRGNADTFRYNTSHSLNNPNKFLASGAQFIPSVLCFYYVAEGSIFLNRGSAHPPSFPMFHSPLPRVENGVRLKQMSTNFTWEFQL